MLLEAAEVDAVVIAAADDEDVEDEDMGAAGREASSSPTPPLIWDSEIEVTGEKANWEPLGVGGGEFGF